MSGLSRSASLRRAPAELLLLLCAALLLALNPLADAQSIAPLPSGIDANGRIDAIAVQFDGKVVLGGLFAAVNGVARSNLARLNPDGSLDTSWNPGADGEVRAIALTASTVYVGGDFANAGAEARSFLAAIDATSGQASAWNPMPNLRVASLAISDDHTLIYAGGSFTKIGTVTRDCIAAIDLVSGSANAWNPGANDYVSGVRVNGSSVYAFGDFTSIAGQPRMRIARFNADGSLDALWNPTPNNATVKTLVVLGSTAYVGGQFLEIGGEPRPFLAALDASAGSTGASLPWNPLPHSDIYAIAASGSAIYIGGTFDQVGGQTRGHVAAIDTLSALPTGWNPASNGTVVYALAAATDRIYVAGDFTTLGTKARTGLAAVSFAASNTVPGAPTIGAASAIGDHQATISFTPPGNDGGTPITSYTVSCVASSPAVTANGSASPITITGLTYLATYACSVQANNAVGSSMPSAMISVTPGDEIFRDDFDGP